MHAKIKDFWGKYETKIVLISGFVLVAVISFEGGVLRGRKMPGNPIVIEKPAEIRGAENSNAPSAGEAPKSAQEASKDSLDNNTPGKQCAFVGSKNSNKYHLPNCRYVKNINAENKVCFSSKEDAAAKGYLPDKNCIK